MVLAKTPATAVALRVGLLELLIVLLGLIFVRKEIYLAGQFKSMLLHWQEYLLLVLMFADGVLRGFGEVQDQGQYHSPFRNRFLRFLLPFTLFLFVSCASLCDKVNVACIQQEWWRDAGLLVLSSGVILSAWQQRSRPKELEAEITALAIDDELEQEECTASGAGKAEADNKSSSQSSGQRSVVEDKRSGAETILDPGTETGKEQFPESDNAPSTRTDKKDPVRKSSKAPSAETGEIPETATSDLPNTETGEVPDAETSQVSGTETKDPGSKSSKDLGEIQAEGPWKLLRYPDRSAILLELIGVSMTLSAWMPLLTLPGLVVAFKWELADLEAFRISQFGEKYLSYKKRTWFLLPYIY